MKLLVLTHSIFMMLLKPTSFYLQWSVLILLESSNSSKRQVLILFVPIDSRSVYWSTNCSASIDRHSSNFFNTSDHWTLIAFLSSAKNLLTVSALKRLKQTSFDDAVSFQRWKKLKEVALFLSIFKFFNIDETWCYLVA